MNIAHSVSLFECDVEIKRQKAGTLSMHKYTCHSTILSFGNRMLYYGHQSQVNMQLKKRKKNTQN